MKLQIYILLVLFLQTGLVFSQEIDFKENPNFGFGVGYALVRFDANVKFTNLQSNQSVFVDIEGTLDLPEADTIPVFYGGYKFSKEHAIGFSYFQVRRESSIFNIDETLDDVTIVGDASFNDDTRFYSLFYSNTLFQDNRSKVQGLIGINALDIRYTLNASGTITYENGSTVGSLQEDTGFFAPLPLFGLDFGFSFTPKWRIDSKVLLVGGSFNEYKALVVSTNVNAKYRFSDHFGGIIGLSYFDADITIEEAQKRTDIRYGYDGIFLGLHAAF